MWQAITQATAALSAGQTAAENSTLTPVNPNAGMQAINTGTSGTPSSSNATPSSQTGTPSKQASIPLATPGYAVEYQNYSRITNFDAPYTYALRYRYKSTSADAPQIVKIATRIYVVAKDEQAAISLDAWIKNGGINNFNSLANTSYLGFAKDIVPEEQTTVFRNILIFENTKYQVDISAGNVSPELSFDIKSIDPSLITNMVVKSATVYTVDGNSYQVQI